jgi:hypothetical protein
MIRFVNACAASIAEEFPHVIIDTFAYQYTRHAPKIVKPLPNVCVRICSIECCFAHPLEHCNEVVYPFKSKVPEGSSFQQDLRDWHAICQRIYVWDYTTNYDYYLSPFPNFQVLQPNMRFFRGNGVVGLFEQGNAESESGEFGELRAYLISKLMWDGDGDVDEWMNEFLTGYYGQSAGAIRAILDRQMAHVKQPDVHMGLLDKPDWYLTPGLLSDLQPLWDEAVAAAENEIVARRVQRSMLQQRYEQLRRMQLSEARTKLVEEFIADVRNLGVTFLAQWVQMEDSFGALREGKMRRSYDFENSDF